MIEFVVISTISTNYKLNIYYQEILLCFLVKKTQVFNVRLSILHVRSTEG